VSARRSPRVLSQRTSSLKPFAAQECLEVPRPVDYPNDFNAVWPRAVQYEHPFEAPHPKDADSCQTWILKATAPAHLRLRSEERECLVRGEQESVTDFGIGLRGKIIGLVF